MSYSLVYKDTKKILSRSRTISITYYTDVCYLQQSTDVLSHPLQSAQAPAHSVFSSQQPFLSAQSLVQVVQSLVQAASSAALLLLQQQDEAASIAAATARAINTFFISLFNCFTKGNKISVDNFIFLEFVKDIFSHIHVISFVSTFQTTDIAF